jgi:hypothetical protein
MEQVKAVLGTNLLSIITLVLPRYTPFKAGRTVIRTTAGRIENVVTTNDTLQSH